MGATTRQSIDTNDSRDEVPQGWPCCHHHPRQICWQEGCIIQPQDSGTKSHPYPHALVAGIERYPQQITRRMSKTRQTKRSKVKPFIRVINYNHLMPTRYTLELEGL